MSSKALESYKIDQIANLKRKELQSLCKKNGIKANSKNVVLIKDLQNKLRQLQKARKAATNSRANKENKSKASNRITSVTKRKPTKRRRRSLKTPSIEPTEPESSPKKSKKKTKTNKKNTNKNTKSKNKKTKSKKKQNKKEKEEINQETEQEKEIDDEKVNEVPEPGINGNDNNQKDDNNSDMDQDQEQDQDKDEAEQPTQIEDISQPVAIADNEEEAMQVEIPQVDNDEMQDQEMDNKEAMQVEISQDDIKEPQPEQQPIQIEDGQEAEKPNQEEKQEPIPINTVIQSNDIGSIPITKQQTEITPNENTEAINDDKQELDAPSMASNHVEITEIEKDEDDQQPMDTQQPLDQKQEEQEPEQTENVEVNQVDIDNNMVSPEISGPVAMDTDADTSTNPVAVKDSNAEIESIEATNTKPKKMICDTDDEDDQYINGNGNNGSFVDIDETPNATRINQQNDENFLDLQQKLQELEKEYVSDTNDMEMANNDDNQPKIHKLGVSQDGFQSNPEEMTTNSVSVAYVNHAMDISNVNNGSLISNEIPDESSNDNLKTGPMIINNDVDAASPLNDTPEQLNESSESLDKTPKLNESTEQFVRASLSVGVDKDPRAHIQENGHISGLQLQFNDEEEDDVDMEVTPDNADNNHNGADTLQDEINRVESLMKSASRNIDNDENSMNTSMLSVNATRITVDSDDSDNDNSNDKEEANIDEPITKTPEKTNKDDSDDDGSPEWKHTPFKAMEIFNSISQSLSVSKSKSVSNDANTNKMEEDQIEDVNKEKEETTDSKVDEYNDDDEVVKDMVITPTGDDNHNIAPPTTSRETAKSVTVENLFYTSPVRIKQKPKPMDAGNEQSKDSSYIQPQSSIKKGDKSVELACTFADGQKFEFKSVYSTSKSISNGIDNKRKSRTSTDANTYRSPCRPRSKSMTPISGECLSEKTAAIRAMMEECEKSYNEGQGSPLKCATSVSMIDTTSSSKVSTNNKRRKSTSLSVSKKENDDNNKKVRKAGDVPDWNAIHNQQIFSRQPDLAQEYKERQARTDRLFGSNKNNSRIDALARSKMSTPGVRQRSKSMISGKNTNTHNSEKRPSKKRVTIVPSSNDHKFNQVTDSKLNRKIQRQPTPYKKNVCDAETAASIAGISGFKNKKASIKPKFNTSFTEDTVAESDTMEDEVINDKVIKDKDQDNDNKNKNTNKIPTKKLAYDPTKVKSRLFQSTSSSKNKLKTKRTSQTPQIMRSTSRNKSVMNKSNKNSVQRNWSAVKSKVDTGRNINSLMKEEGQRITGIKRKLSWSVSDQNRMNIDNKNENKIKEPVKKKRRMSHSVSSNTSNNGNNNNNNIKRWQ